MKQNNKGNKDSINIYQIVKMQFSQIILVKYTTQTKLSLILSFNLNNLSIYDTHTSLPGNVDLASVIK